MPFFIDGKEEFLPKLSGGFFVGIGKHFHLRFFQQFTDVYIFDELHQLFVFRGAFKDLIELQRSLFLSILIEQRLSLFEQLGTKVSLSPNKTSCGGLEFAILGGGVGSRS